ncbi:AAA family ATPase [Dactylosporangium sp. AC04546]|uniref:AAA family ATPase n=1 Tax=Dactylosporangium sp. AC04546 TaxID=2862460 RepID=UPI001EDEE296|nr:AAA family ATPase [Dactylosporangium sp. AC04546]WVK89646.1 AAA family ATPase [Dactylosporangium sp. AC04546]
MDDEPLSPAEVRSLTNVVNRIAGGVASAVLGKPEVVRLAVTAVLAEGHLLVEDVPGVGKTTLARALSTVVGGVWRRIQCTPDLLPSDITGVTVYRQADAAFEFRPGPVFANVVLADELNRASPKTQSALLEVMEERQVTVDGVRYPVPAPFLVVATQNPVEAAGTYPLPEAQLDRFLMKLSVGYPDEDAEVDVVRNASAGRSPDDLPPVADPERLRAVVALAARAHVADALYRYAVRLAAATRTHPAVRVGASPRGAVALARAARAYACTAGRGYVVPEDLQDLLEPVLAHRLVLAPESYLQGVTPRDVLRDVVWAVPVPAPVAA